MKINIRKLVFFGMAFLGGGPLHAHYFFVLPLPYPIDYLEKIPLAEKIEIEAADRIEEEPPSEFAPLIHPDFKNQPEALGYTPGETFRVPKELREQVEFWKLIYHHYSMNQYVLHDADAHVVYDIVDIGDIVKRRGSYRQERKLVNQRLQHYRLKIRDLLNTLHEKQDSPSLLTIAERKIYDQFQRVDGADKFLRAKYKIRAQLGQKERFEQGVIWAGRYLPMMEEIFRQEQLPMELTRLPFVESSFNLKARSRVGASGIWQFIRSTGKRFLQINLAVDERNDPIEATRAAARFLKMNYEALQNWPLAITAYNHGGSGMMRAIQQVGSNDIVEVIQNYRSPTFGFASKNFYTEFLAALDVEVEYEKYFGPLQVEAPLKFEEVTLSAYLNIQTLMKYTNLSQSLIKRFNPGLTQYVYSGKKRIPAQYKLKLPDGTKESFVAALGKVPSQVQYASQRRSLYHRVRSGDTLSYIARRYGTSVSLLREANRLGRHIYAGQTLVIPH